MALNQNMDATIRMYAWKHPTKIWIQKMKCMHYVDALLLIGQPKQNQWHWQKIKQKSTACRLSIQAPHADSRANKKQYTNDTSHLHTQEHIVHA